MEIGKAIEVLSKHKKSYEQSIRSINTVNEINKDWNGTSALGQPMSEDVYKRNKDNLESIDLAIQALEKQMPKKPIWYEDIAYTCPICEQTLERDYDTCCHYCGQKLNWGDEQ